jgi:hypothetical protein
MKDSKSLLLLLLTGGLVITWVYHIYDKSRYSNGTHEISVKDSLGLVKAFSDSVRNEFRLALNRLDSVKIKADTINNYHIGNVPGQKTEEIDQLRKEIENILEKKNLTQADLEEVNTKIKSMGQLMERLPAENSSLAEEYKKPGTAPSENSGEETIEQNTTGKTAAEKKSVSKLNIISPFSVSAIRFAALGNKNEQQETETMQQADAQKFTCSFILQNPRNDIAQAEIYIVIRDPLGKTVNTEVWDAGSFETLSEGKKIYTRKLKFEYRKGELKRISITVEPDSFEKGEYKLWVYQNGIRIAESNWRLN